MKCKEIKRKRNKIIYNFVMSENEIIQILHDCNYTVEEVVAVMLSRMEKAILEKESKSPG